MPENPKRNLHLVSNKSQVDLAKREALDACVAAASVAAANLMRVVRGAGKPHRILHDAIDMAEAFQKYFELARHYPGEEVASCLRTRLRDDFERHLEWDDGIDQMVKGALQVAASRLTGQMTQESRGQSELISGLTVIETIRSENRSKVGI